VVEAETRASGDRIKTSSLPSLSAALLRVLESFLRILQSPNDTVPSHSLSAAIRDRRMSRSGLLARP
jgi:hypothetical protein